MTQVQVFPLPEVVDNAINGMSEEANTIKALQGVVDIDDDNEPAPKNVPTADNSNRLLSTEWGHGGFCFRGSQNFGSTWAKLNFSVDTTCHGYYIQLFKGFFPKQLLQNVIDIVNEKMDGDKEVVYGEFIWWIGICVLMSTVMVQIGIRFGQPKMSMLLMVHHFISPLLCHTGTLRKSFTT